MELIPLITNIIYYFLIALLLVLIISFAISKIFRNKKEEKITQSREQIRKYIRNHHQYVTNNTNLKPGSTNRAYYGVPAISYEINRTVNKPKTVNQVNTVIIPVELSSDENKLSDNSRYCILNSAQSQNKPSIKNYPLG